MKLLAVLSVLAAWAFNGVLLAGLLSILKALEGVRQRLEKITMGVRAIETETAPLATHAGAVATSLEQVVSAGGALAGRLADVDRDLDAAAAALQART